MPWLASLRWVVGIGSVVVTMALVLAGQGGSNAQEPKSEKKGEASDTVGTPPIPPRSLPVAPQGDAVDAARKPAVFLLPELESIKPEPDRAIPDDPPPHEGAMVEFPYHVQVPDIIIVEVLEALPGRPISGERLVRPDGTITLGFYGELHVAGLTTTQIKEKIILHLRKFIEDEALGLFAEEIKEPANPAPAEREAVPVPRIADPEPPKLPAEDRSPFDPRPEDKPKPELRSSSSHASNPRIRLARQLQAKRPGPLREPKFPVRSEFFKSQAAQVPDVDAETLEAMKKAAEAGPQPEVPRRYDSRRIVPIAPRDSDRVFVDVASYNSQVYYVLGMVHQGGRFPATGNETVLDALQFAGGIAQGGDAKDVRLVRPARGGKPARVFPIDLEAIRDRGDAKANLQIFAGDRLVVGSEKPPEIEDNLD